MAFSFAAIPMPVLVGVPIAALLVGVGLYEYEKHKQAAAAAAAQPPQPAPPAAQPTTPPAGMGAPMGMAGPVGVAGPVSASAPVLAAMSNMAQLGISPASMFTQQPRPRTVIVPVTLPAPAPKPKVVLLPVVEKAPPPKPKVVLLPITMGPPAPAPKPKIVLMPIQAGPAPSQPVDTLTQAQQLAQQLLSNLPSPFPNDQSYGINEQVVQAALGQFISDPSVAQLATTLTDLQQNGSGPALDAYNQLSVYVQAPPASPTDPLAQAQQLAQQLLANLPSPFPNDQSFGINAQVVQAALGQFIATPTAAQLATTLTDLQQNGSGPAIDAYNQLNVYTQALAA